MDLEKAKRALVNAHKAGDTRAATAIAKAIKAAEVGGQSKYTGAVDSITQGMTFGFGDNLTALEAGILGRTPEGGWFDYSKSFGDRYDDALKAERGQQDKFREANPGTAIAGELLGGMVTGAGLAGSGATLVGRTAGRHLLTRGAAGAAEGAAYGAAYGAGNADGADMGESIADGAKLGAAFGAAIPAIGSGLRKGAQAMATRRAAKANAPSREALKNEASTAFKAAEDAGVRLSERSRGSLVQGISDDLSKKYRPGVHTETKKVLAEFNSFIESQPTLSNLQDYRSFVVGQLRNIDPNKKMEREFLGQIIENLDNYAERISVFDVVYNAGGRKAALDQLKRGRELWKRLRKDEILEEAFFKAQNQASGFENGLRTQFRQIVNNKR
ncbi:MAG: hypothetical protein HRT64_14735, partial [Erythrobacter sp.]|nr:hypothetical protein [Erythrobacter sp.]